MAITTATDALLVACEPYFLDGVLTIAQFAQRTQALVRKAVERHRGPLVEALGFTDDEIAVEDYCYPNKLHKANPSDAVSLGVRLKVSNLFATGIYRYWKVEKKASGVEAYTWIKGRAKLDQLSTEIRQLPDMPPPPTDSCIDSFDGICYITRELGASEIGEVDLRLDELITDYICLLKKVGGVKRFLSADSSSEA